jgi:hypothetical protein
MNTAIRSLSMTALTVAVFSALPARGEDRVVRLNAGEAGCLHVKGGSGASAGEVRLAKPCSDGPAFAVTLLGAPIELALRVTLAPQDARCLRFKPPLSASDLPVAVTAGSCVQPTFWTIRVQEDGIHSEVIVTSDGVGGGTCLQPDAGGAVVVDFCSKTSVWTVEKIGAAASPAPQG